MRNAVLEIPRLQPYLVRPLPLILIPNPTSHIRLSTFLLTDPRLTLKEPCRPGRNLLTCPDFSARQPDGPATLWDMPCKRAPPRTCPWCDFNGDYDMGRIRVVKVKTVGFRIGTGPGRNDEGVDVFCCTVM